MSTVNHPPAADADGAAFSSWLLPRLIMDISRSISSLTLSVSPASPVHRQSSALAGLLHRLLVGLPSQPQHRRNENDLLQEPEVNGPHGFLPNSLLQLDIFRVLFSVADNLRHYLSIIAQSPSDGVQEDSQSIAGTREKVGLLTEREIYMKESSSCLEWAMGTFRYKKVRALEKEGIKGMEIDDNELRKRLMVSVSELTAYLDHLDVSLQKVIKEFSSTVVFVENILISSQHRTNFSTAACLRTVIRSFLYTREEDTLSMPELADFSSRHGDAKLTEKSEMVVERLLNPQEAKIIGLGGGRGLGKTCLASYIECNSRIKDNFPGGVYYVYMGTEPRLTSLQAQLWKQMWRGSICYSPSKPTFKTPEEGTAALESHAREGLPCLLVLDDVHDLAHLKPFLCFSNGDGCRMLVISRIVERILEDWKDDASVLVLESWDAEEAHCLFKSIAGCQDAEKMPAMIALTGACHGAPRLIEAAASIAYYRDASPPYLPSILSLCKEGVATKSESNQRVINILPSTTMVACEGEKSPGALSDEEGKAEEWNVPLSSFQDFTDPTHNLLLDTLAEIHPGLQECFLDLAAFPKGSWVSLSTLMDIWSFGNKKEKEKVIFVLCLLASRSLVEWKTEASVDNDFDQSLPYHWRMVDFFHELAQSYIQRKLKNASKLSALAVNNNKQISDGSQNIPANSSYDASRILDLLRTALNDLDRIACMQTKKITCYVSGHESKQLYDAHAIDLQGGKDLAFSWSMLLQTNFQCFFPGSLWDKAADSLNDENVANTITKLSLISANFTTFPGKGDFGQLKVALLSSNAMLKSLPERPFKSMEHLIVLNLKQCTSLTSLPDSICSLPCLEVLELSGCTGLVLLPKTIGKLKSLKYLDLSGCLSLTCLPASTGSLKFLMTINLSSCSRLKRLPNTIGNLFSLQMLNLSGCYSLLCLPNTVGGLQKLHTVIISGCSNLSYTPPVYYLLNMAGGRMNRAMAVPLQFWRLGQVEVLHLCSLKNLTFLPQSIANLQHLRHLNLSSSRSLDYLPDEIGSLFLLENLDLSHTAIRKLPKSLGQLSSLVRLCLQGCSRLLCIPPTLCALLKLERLEMAECWDLVMLPDEFGLEHSLPKLTDLDLSGCSIRKLPCFMKGALPVIQRLCLASCENLSALPISFGTITSLERLDLAGCKSLFSLEDVGIGNLKQLQWINLRNCLLLTILPVLELLSLQNFKFLDVSGCTKLSPFPEPLLQHAREHRLTLVRWGTVWH